MAAIRLFRDAGTIAEGRSSLRGFRLRSAFGDPVRNDVGEEWALGVLPPDVIPDGRAALGAAEPEPTRRFDARARGSSSLGD
jgi:hypothetical protein